MCFSNKPQDEINDYFKNIHQLCLDKYNKLIYTSIRGFPEHVRYINNELRKAEMDKDQLNRFLKLSSINDVNTYNIHNLSDGLISAYNNTWCRNNVFSCIEDGRRLKICPLALPPLIPGDRRP